MKRINLNIDDAKHAAFKAKAAAAGLAISDVLNAAIADYMAGKWSPKTEKKESKPIDK